jgi:hypothetical protein
MLASEILRRIILTSTTTKLRALSGGADVGTFNAGGLAVSGDIDAADVAAATFTRGLQWLELDGGEINPVAAAADYTLTPPPGFYFIALRWGTIQTQLDGTLTSSAVANVGNDAAKVNVAASSPSVFGTLTQINTAPTGVKQYNVGLNTLNPAVSNMESTTTPFTLQITTPAVLNTATIYRVRCFLLGALIPV